MELDLISFKKAIDSLAHGIEISHKLIKGEAETYEEKLIRSGVIQNFEFTYELSWKFMQRWLSENVDPEVTSLSRKELFRMAYERKLIENVEDWFEYHKARNITAHTYDEVKADLVYKLSEKFLKDTKILLERLEK